jgi:hypothetical protein
MSTEKKERPDRNGWWNWYESGSSTPEKILLTANGAVVASDDEWQQATGVHPENDVAGTNANYWEGTDTTQEMMPGLWEFIDQTPPKVEVTEEQERNDLRKWVRNWLFTSDKRQSEGQPWDEKQMRDVVSMLHDFKKELGL